jgi:hypothetical protein
MDCSDLAAPSGGHSIPMVLTFAIALVSGSLGMAGGLWISRREGEAARRREMRLAYSALLGAISQSVATFRGMPPARETPLLDAARRKWLGENGEWVAN